MIIDIQNIPVAEVACSIYENRPWICREFEMGSYECLHERSANR